MSKITGYDFRKRRTKLKPQRLLNIRKAAKKRASHNRKIWNYTIRKRIKVLENCMNEDLKEARVQAMKEFLGRWLNKNHEIRLTKINTRLLRARKRELLEKNAVLSQELIIKRKEADIRRYEGLTTGQIVHRRHKKKMKEKKIALFDL